MSTLLPKKFWRLLKGVPDRHGHVSWWLRIQLGRWDISIERHIPDKCVEEYFHA